MSQWDLVLKEYARNRGRLVLLVNAHATTGVAAKIP
jgi:hypothetical protein